MDSDVIRREIDTTAERIDRELQALEDRARTAAQTAVAWMIVTAAAAGLLAAAMIWSRVRRRRPLRPGSEFGRALLTATPRLVSAGPSAASR